MKPGASAAEYLDHLFPELRVEAMANSDADSVLQGHLDTAIIDDSTKFDEGARRFCLRASGASYSDRVRRTWFMRAMIRIRPTPSRWGSSDAWFCFVGSRADGSPTRTHVVVALQRRASFAPDSLRAGFSRPRSPSSGPGRRQSSPTQSPRCSRPSRAHRRFRGGP